MRLEELVFSIKSKGQGEKTIAVIVEPDGLTIITEGDDVELTTEELHYSVSVAFMYIGAYLNNLPVNHEFVLEKAYHLYRTFTERYRGLKAIDEMSIEEFNEFMKRYNGREDN